MTKGLKLITVTPSDRREKKYKAVFEKKNGKTLTRHFGQKNSSTYLDHKDKSRRARYIQRHSNEIQFYNDPTRPATLSRYILWGNSTKLSEALKKFKQKFNV